MSSPPEEPEFKEMTVDMFDENSEDQLTKERSRCMMADCHVQKSFEHLRECNKRVMSKIRYTAETCTEEMVDWIEALDHCANGPAFSNCK